MSGVLNDQNGNPSSKRVAGIALCVIGTGILVAVAVVAMDAKEARPQIQMAYDAGFALIGAGAGLLGIGVIEFFAPRK